MRKEPALVNLKSAKNMSYIPNDATPEPSGAIEMKIPPLLQLATLAAAEEVTGEDFRRVEDNG